MKNFEKKLKTEFGCVLKKENAKSELLRKSPKISFFYLFLGPNKENDENPDFEKILAFLKEFMDSGLEKFLKEQAKIKKTITTVDQKSYLRSDHALLNIVLDSVNTYELLENELR